MTFYIHRREPLEDGLKRIAREQLGRVLEDLDNETLAAETKIHSVRSRCKKMRALLRLPGPVMGNAFAIEDARFRDIGRRLAELRDEHVRGQTLAAVSGGSGPDGGADTASAETPDSVLAESRLDIRRAFDAIDRWQLNSESLCDILPGLTRTYREGRDAWLFALREPTDEHFHELRKWTKYLWYHSRILERANKKKLRPRRVLLHDLEKLLGHAHDLAVLQSTLESRAWLHRSMLGQIDEQKRRLYPEALEMSRRLYAASPDRLAADLARWWEVWRRQ